MDKEKRRLKRVQEAQKFRGVELGVFISEGEHLTCLVCDKPIKKRQLYRRLPPDGKTPEWRYYHWPECGPGTEAWHRFHPSRISELMLKGKEVIRERRLKRRALKLGKSIDQIKEETMKKTAEKGKGLKPMEPVKIPESVIKKQKKEVQELLRKLEKTERSSSEARTIRKELRKLGFRLSDFRGDDVKNKKPTDKKKEKTAQLGAEEE